MFLLNIIISLNRNGINKTLHACCHSSTNVTVKANFALVMGKISYCAITN